MDSKSLTKTSFCGKEIDNVRCKQISNEADKLEICKNCSFKDTFDWIC